MLLPPSSVVGTVVCNIMYNATSGQRLTQRGTHLLAPDLSGVFGARNGGPAHLFGHQGLLLLQFRISWNGKRQYLQTLLWQFSDFFEHAAVL